MMPATYHVLNNTPNPREFTPSVGGGKLRFPPGWSKVDSGPVDAITGGFDRNGKARGGVAARYFNDPIELDSGDFRPVLQIGTPVTGTKVTEIEELPGSRKHYRTRDDEARSAREAEQAAKIARLEAQIESLAKAVESGAIKAEAPSEETAIEQPKRSGKKGRG